MNFETIGFDFDQTLADSKSGISSCLRMLSLEFNLAENTNQIYKLAVSGLALEPMLKKLFDMNDIEMQKERFLDLYPTLGIAGTELIPGAKDLVDYLANQGHRLVLISAKGQKNLELSVEHLGLKFDYVFGGASGMDKTRIMIENRTYLYVGDQLSDVIAANAANATAVLIAENPAEIDFSIYPHKHFGSLKELHESISQLTKR